MSLVHNFVLKQRQFQLEISYLLRPSRSLKSFESQNPSKKELKVQFVCQGEKLIVLYDDPKVKAVQKTVTAY